jgi:hypothetical protein
VVQVTQVNAVVNLDRGRCEPFFGSGELPLFSQAAIGAPVASSLSTSIFTSINIERSIISCSVTSLILELSVEQRNITITYYSTMGYESTIQFTLDTICPCMLHPYHPLTPTQS